VAVHGASMISPIPTMIRKAKKGITTGGQFSRGKAQFGWVVAFSRWKTFFSDRAADGHPRSVVGFKPKVPTCLNNKHEQIQVHEWLRCY